MVTGHWSPWLLLRPWVHLGVLPALDPARERAQGLRDLSLQGLASQRTRASKREKETQRRLVSVLPAPTLQHELLETEAPAEADCRLGSQSSAGKMQREQQQAPPLSQKQMTWPHHHRGDSHGTRHPPHTTGRGAASQWGCFRGDRKPTLSWSPKCNVLERDPLSYHRDLIKVRVTGRVSSDQEAVTKVQQGEGPRSQRQCDRAKNTQTVFDHSSTPRTYVIIITPMLQMRP